MSAPMIKTFSLGVSSAVFAVVGLMFSGSAAAFNGGGGDDGCDSLSAGEETCTIDGREYILYVPNSYDSNSGAPLVVDMHGYTSNNSQQQGISGWNDLADEEGFVVAYPQGESNSWNAQGQCCGSTTADDVSFIRDMVGSIQSAGNINSNEIYATGLSNGGSMTHTLACEAADLFAGAAPVAFGLSGGTGFNGVVRNCNPSEGIDVIHFHGTSDGVVDYNNGVLGSLGAEDSLEAWREIQSCDSGSSMQQLSSNTSCQVYSGCDGGARVAMCAVQGGAHALYPDVNGAGVAEFSWNFFHGGF